MSIKKEYLCPLIYEGILILRTDIYKNARN